MKPSIPYIICVLVFVPLGTFIALGGDPTLIKAIVSVILIPLALMPCRNDFGGDGGGSWGDSGGDGGD